MLNVIMLSVIMLSVIMLSVIMLNVIMLNIVKLSVVAPNTGLVFRKLLTVPDFLRFQHISTKISWFSNDYFTAGCLN